MDKMMAQHSIRTAFYLSRCLVEYLEIVKSHTTAEEFDILKHKVAEAVDKINVALIDTSVSKFPDIDKEIEDALNKYGRYI